jgi:hypothetical protein
MNSDLLLKQSILSGSSKFELVLELVLSKAEVIVLALDLKSDNLQSCLPTGLLYTDLPI